LLRRLHIGLISLFIPMHSVSPLFKKAILKTMAAGIALTLVADPTLAAAVQIRSVPVPAAAHFHDVFSNQAVVPGLLLRLHSFQEHVTARFDRTLSATKKISRTGSTALRFEWLSGRWAVAATLLMPLVIHWFLGHSPAAAGAALSSLIGIPSGPPPGEFHPTLLKALNAKSSLLFSKNADAIQAAFLQYTRAQPKPPLFVRLTLREKSDLDRLRTRIHVDTETGDIHPEDGDLLRVIKEGGILMIDYNGSDPALLAGFNSLFDDPAYFGRDNVSPDLHVIGVMKDELIDKRDGSFYSRFEYVASLDLPFEDPVRRIGAPPSTFAGPAPVTLHLWDSPHFQGPLTGRYHLNIEGRIEALEGAFAHAIETKAPLIIRGGLWGDPGFEHLLRQILMHGEFEFNGKPVVLPEDFQLYREPENYVEGLEGRRIVLTGEVPTAANQAVWIINKENVDSLFTQTHIDAAGRYTQQLGLASLSGDRLRVTERLPEWAWHRLLHEYPAQVIEIMPGVEIPRVYRDAILSRIAIEASRIPKSHPLEDVLAAQASAVHTSEPSVIIDRLQRLYPGRPVTSYPATPETSIEILTASNEIISTIEGKRTFGSKEKGVLRALRAGEIVVIEGLESNEALQRELETVLYENPYLLVNGQRMPLKGLPGRLVLISKTRPEFWGLTPHFASFEPSSEELQSILRREFPGRFSEENFKRIEQLKAIFETISKPEIDGQYPDRPNFSLSRLRLLHQFDNWFDAFDHVFISDYVDNPEVAAFMRTMVRTIFEVEEPKRPEGRILGRRLQKGLDKSVGEIPWRKHFWEFADTLPLDTLKTLSVDRQYQPQSTHGVFQELQRALVAEAVGEKQTYYQRKFTWTGSTEGALPIDRDSHVGELTWEERVERAVALLTLVPGVFFQGDPGTGKSHLASQEMVRELRYAPHEVIEPFSLGPDIKEADVVIRQKLKDGRTDTDDEAIARWAKLPDGGLLLVDEANSAAPGFLNLFRGAFSQERVIWINGERIQLTPRHKIILTGNSNTVEGRRRQALIHEFMPTLPFTAPSDKFLLQKADDYLASNKTRREELGRLLIDLYRFFEQNAPHLGFSLRDLQELTARVNHFTEAEWDQSQVIGTAWDQYYGMFEPEERVAMENLAMQRWGVDLRARDRKRIDDVRRELGGRYFSPEFGRPIVLVDATARMIAVLLDFLRIREVRKGAKARVQGKRGLIAVGPSALGKDTIVRKTLGFHSIIDSKEEIPEDLTSLYYYMTADFQSDEMTETIHDAQRDGSVAIVSEMDLLPSAQMEGKIGDALAGSAADAHAFLATANAFSIRQKLSSALLNRVIYLRLQDYTQAELLEILMGLAQEQKADKDLAKTIQLGVATHVWIRDHIKNPMNHPTLRDLLKILQREPGESPMETVLRVYQPLYLDKLVSERLPNEAKLLNFHEAPRLDNVRVAEKIGSYVIRHNPQPFKVQVHEGGSAAGFYRKPENLMSIAKVLMGQPGWDETVWHELSHGAFEPNLPWMPEAGLVSRARDLVQDMRDLRNQAAFTSHFPASGMNLVSDVEEKLAALVRERNISGLWGWMSSSEKPLSTQHLFQYSMVAFAKGLIDTEDVADMAKMVDRFFNVNPFYLALPHLNLALEIALAIPESLGGEEVEYQYFRMLARLETMAEDYKRIPNEGLRNPGERVLPVPSAAQAAAPEKMFQALDWAPVKAPEVKVAIKITPVSGSLRKNRQAVRNRMKQAQEKVSTAVEKRLIDLETELQSSQGVPSARLEAMRDELTDLKNPSGLRAEIESARNRRVSRRAKRLEAQINKRLGVGAENAGRTRRRVTWVASLAALALFLYWAFPQAAAFLHSLWSNAPGPDVAHIPARSNNSGRYEFDRVQVLLGVLLALGLLTIARLMRRMINWQSIPFAQHSEREGNAAHSGGETENITEFLLSKEKPRRADVSLNMVESAQRDTRLQGVSELNESKLLDGFSDLASDRRKPTKDHHANGAIFDIHHFAIDPAKPFLRSDSRLERVQTEIVLVGAKPGEIWQGTWDPILQETLRFLFDHGYRMTVYLSPTSYVDGIQTLSDLQRVLRTGHTFVSREVIEENLEARQKLTESTPISLQELESRTAATYIAGAFAQIARNASGRSEPAPPGAAAVTAQTTPSNTPAPAMDALDQIHAAQQWFTSHGMDPKRHVNFQLMAQAGEKDFFAIDTGDVPVTKEDLVFFSQLSHLSKLTMKNLQSPDLHPLRELSELTSLEISDAVDLTALESMPQLKNLVFLTSAQPTDKFFFQLYQVLRNLPDLEDLGFQSFARNDRALFDLFRYASNPPLLRISVEDRNLRLNFDDIPAEYQQPSSFDQEVAWIRHAVEKRWGKGSDDPAVFTVATNKPDELFTLNFINLPIDDAFINSWPAFRFLDVVNIRSGRIKSLAGFSRSKNLSMLDIFTGSYTRADALNALRLHPNPLLRIYVPNRKGKEIRVGPEDFIPALTAAKDILSTLGGMRWVKVTGADYKVGTFSLNFRRDPEGVADFSFWKKAPGLIQLELEGITGVTNIEKLFVQGGLEVLIVEDYLSQDEQAKMFWFLAHHPNPNLRVLLRQTPSSSSPERFDKNRIPSEFTARARAPKLLTRDEQLEAAHKMMKILLQRNAMPPASTKVFFGSGPHVFRVNFRKASLTTHELNEIASWSFLTELDLSDVSVDGKPLDSVQFVFGLSHLKSFGISHSAVTDVTPLGYCPLLETLAVADIPADLSPLARSPKLATLIIGELTPEKRAVLPGIKNLDFLSISSVGIDAAAIDQLFDSIPQLQKVVLQQHGSEPEHLINRKAREQDALSHAPALSLEDQMAAAKAFVAAQGHVFKNETVYKGENGFIVNMPNISIPDLAVMSSWPQMEGLLLHGARGLTDVAQLEPARQVQTLILDATRITHISALAKWPHLEILSMRYCAIQDLQSLSASKTLNHLLLDLSPAAVEALAAMPKLSILVADSISRDFDIMSLTKLKHLRSIHLPKNAGSIEQIAEMMQRHPNASFPLKISIDGPRVRLVFNPSTGSVEVWSSGDVLTREIPALPGRLRSPQEIAARITPEEAAFLKRLIANRSDETLLGARNRFKDEGREDLFDRMLQQISGSPPAQTPITRALWSVTSSVLPRSWRLSRPLQAFFTSVTEFVLYFAAPLGTIAVVGSYWLDLSPVANGVLIVLSGLALQKLLFQPAHGWVPLLLRRRGYQPVPVITQTAGLGWALSALYGASIALLGVFPALAVGGMLSGILIHTLYDIPRLTRRYAPSKAPHLPRKSLLTAA
jgi:Leucine-rich repeat (LRR) protein